MSLYTAAVFIFQSFNLSQAVGEIFHASYRLNLNLNETMQSLYGGRRRASSSTGVGLLGFHAFFAFQ